ncbi:hypothetical protein LMG29542_01048 [Paraburkholderia humisilvae]|uniref:Uncharacterized protein n=2 Tax=Paraburkholderia humisilvae TaxID=627669 RepID=A0A6J5D880_9BURK|nr:hypothetical protein LMG29542_01048 [Paraburkholderia humisilvae]
MVGRVKGDSAVDANGEYGCLHCSQLIGHYFLLCAVFAWKFVALCVLARLPLLLTKQNAAMQRSGAHHSNDIE